MILLKNYKVMQKQTKRTKSTTTAIKQRELKSDKDGTAYDLSGRRVTNPKNGVYVKNGKKIAIK